MSVNYVDKSTGNLVRVAGQGKAEYGASTVRKGTVGVPAIAANADYVDQTITFSTPMPDTDYLVDLSLQGSNTHRVAFHVVANTKTVNGFTVRFTPIGVKQTTEVGVSGIANNLSYMLTVQRDDTYPNLTKNVALIDPTVSLPTEWNPMQTGYLRNPMPANESTLVYTAFKLYTDTEYNNLLNNAVLTSDVTDSVTNGDMNPVTSNAVYDTLNASITDLTADETVMTYEDYTVETLGAHMYQVGGLCWVHIDIRVTYTGEVALDTDGHKDFWSNKFSIPDFDDVSEWNAVPCFGYVSNSHRRFEITLNNFGVTGGQKAIVFRLRYGEDEPIYTGDVFNLRCVCCFAKA